MAERIEIKDQESAEAWLETQEHQTQVWFAARCALRGLPGLGIEADATTSGFALAVFRASLISAGAGTWPPADISVIAEAVYSAARSADSAVSAALSAVSAARSAVSAARSADSAALSAAHSAARSAAHSADSAAHSADSVADSALSAAFAAADADQVHVGRWPALWPSDTMPEGLAAGWQDLKAQLDQAPKVWGFWRDWYEALLAGTWTDWELIYRIAAEITPDQWDAGPETVAEQIEKIEKELNDARVDQESDKIAPEAVSPDNVVSLFGRAPIVRASMASLSETISLRVDAFSRMQRPNEAIPFIDALNTLPETAERIAEILEKGRDKPDAESALALEVGRLRAEVEQLKSALKSANAELDTLRKKPWYRSASILLPVTVVSAITTGLWTLSGDDKILEHRWNKLAVDLQFLTHQVWPEPEDRFNEPLRFELPEIDEV